MLTLLGCGQTADRSGGSGSLEWTTRIVDDDTVEVTLTDPGGLYRVEQVTLVGPAGQSIGAYELARTTLDERGSYGPGIATGVSIGSSGRSGAGVGLSFPIITGRSRAPRRQTDAKLRLPAQDLYRLEAAVWRIRVDLTDNQGQPSSAEIPAPLPSTQ